MGDSTFCSVYKKKNEQQPVPAGRTGALRMLCFLLYLFCCTPVPCTPYFGVDFLCCGRGGAGDRSCVELFESMGMGTLDAYVADLEEKLLQNTKEHYARKSHEWIETDSTPDYMIKVCEFPNEYRCTQRGGGTHDNECCNHWKEWGGGAGGDSACHSTW